MRLTPKNFRVSSVDSPVSPVKKLIQSFCISSVVSEKPVKVFGVSSVYSIVSPESTRIRVSKNTKGVTWSSVSLQYSSLLGLRLTSWARGSPKTPRLYATQILRLAPRSLISRPHDGDSSQYRPDQTKPDQYLQQPNCAWSWALARLVMFSAFSVLLKSPLTSSSSDSSAGAETTGEDNCQCRRHHRHHHCCFRRCCKPAGGSCWRDHQFC